MRLTDAMIRFLGSVLTGEQFAAMIITGREEARAARAARLAAQKADSVRVSESGFPPAVPVSGGVLKDRARAGLLRPAGLTGAMLSVAALILDRYVIATGRCDLGIATMAGQLGLSERSVRRALAALDARGLVSREIHGGRHHANAYRPNFEALARIGLGRPAAANPDSETKPGLNRTAESAKTESLLKTSSTEGEVGARGIGRRREPDRRQRELMLPVVVEGGRAAVPPQPAAIAREQAGLRVMQALNRHLARFPPRFAERTRADIGAELLEAAIVAEVRAKGSGIAVILDGLGPGPPATASAAG